MIGAVATALSTASDARASTAVWGWSVGACGYGYVRVADSVNDHIEVTVKGAPGTGAYGSAGGGGKAGGGGGIVKLTFSVAQLPANRILSWVTGCTSKDNAGGTGFTAGGTSTPGQGAGGGSTGVCFETLSCGFTPMPAWNLMAVAGGGGGGGGGTCIGYGGWAGGPGGSGAGQYASYEHVDGHWAAGGNGDASPGSGGSTVSGTSAAGQDGSSGGGSGGGGGYPYGGRAGTDYGFGGCASKGGGGGGSSWANASRTVSSFPVEVSTSGGVVFTGYAQ